MKRRSFLRASMITGVLAGAPSLIGKAAKKDYFRKAPTAELYELRVYTLKNANQQKLVEDFFQHTGIPALNRYGSKNIGVFTEQKPEGQSRLYVIIPYSSVKDFMSVNDKLATDDAYQRQGAA